MSSHPSGPPDRGEGLHHPLPALASCGSSRAHSPGDDASCEHATAGPPLPRLGLPDGPGAPWRGPGGEAQVHDMLKRHAIQVLLAAGHTQEEVARELGVGVRTVRRILNEPEVHDVDLVAERKRRSVGRPSKVEGYRELIENLLGEKPDLKTLEILRQCRLRGYDGGKSALYGLVSELRSKVVDFHMRFEGLPGEFSQHDFGQVVVEYLDGTKERIHFFASRLKWSRWSRVSVVPNQQAETLIRALLDHFEDMGGVPLCAVFDRPKTVALKWSKDGKVTDWNPTFAYAALEIGFTAEVCWPHAPRQKGAVENLVGWVKGSFFKQRRFHDRADLLEQLEDWHREVNEERPSRATGEIPEKRRQEERTRLRAAKVTPDELALRLPVTVGPTAHVVHDTHPYSMPPKAAGLPGTLYLHRDRVRIVAGRHEVEHPRIFEREKGSTLPEHRAKQLAAVAGTRGKRYLKRQHLLETGAAAEHFLTELVHRRAAAWVGDVERLHDLLERYGPDAMNRALRAAVDVERFDVGYVVQVLAAPADTQGHLFSGGEA